LNIFDRGLSRSEYGSSKPLERQILAGSRANWKFFFALARKFLPPESFEKQNRLQMSQVLPFRASMIRWALLFKDSISKGAPGDRLRRTS